MNYPGHINISVYLTLIWIRDINLLILLELYYIVKICNVYRRWIRNRKKIPFFQILSSRSCRTLVKDWNKMDNGKKWIWIIHFVRTQDFPQKNCFSCHFLPHDTCTYVGISGSKKWQFFKIVCALTKCMIS